jgi:hypothetical protein
MRPEDTLALLQVKTTELSRQHEAFTGRARELRAEESSLREPRARFAALHRGLTELAASGHVFEDASFADGLAEEIACGTASEAAIADGVERLSQELDCAARRGAAAVLYGRLFDANEIDLETTAELPGRAEVLASLQAFWSSEAEVDGPALAAVLGACARPTPDVTAEEFVQPVSSEEVSAHLITLAQSFDHAADFRAYCRRLATDKEGVRDLSGALTILLRDLDRAPWQDWSTPITLRWNRTRWRAFLAPTLLPQLLFECVALRLGVLARRSWLPRNLQARQRPLDFFHHRRDELTAQLVLPGIGTSIQDYTAQAPSAYAGAGSITGAADPYQRLFLLVNADLWWHTTAFEQRRALLAQTDLKDFFPSLPQATVLAVLDAMGVPPHVSRFVARYLRGPYLFEGQLVVVKTGLFPGQTLSRILADALLIALDTWVERMSGVPVARFMDDIFWTTHEPAATLAAWQAVQEFARVAGLRCNEEKTGLSVLAPADASSVELPAGLPPRRRVRWAFLELAEEGTWVPRAEAVEEFLSTLRRRVQAPAPVRQRVREYNAAIGYLVRGLAPLAPLGVAHVDRLNATLGRVHGSLWGPGQGMTAHLRAMLKARSPALEGLISELPTGWFSWPITAGGLGLYNPASLLAGARAAQRSHALPGTPAPVDEPCRDANWTLFYQHIAQVTLQVLPPTPSPAMAGRQRDFIARGGELQGRPQSSLHPYWQWLLETHAPSLLSFFGTLRFLPTEVVPVQPLGVSSPSLVMQQQRVLDDDIPF